MNLLENEAFCTGVQVGINLHQQRIIKAHERGKPVPIGDSLYYIQDGRQRLEEAVERICE